jgi:hypothetical protein
MKKYLLEVNRKFWNGFENIVENITIPFALFIVAILEACGIDTTSGFNDDDFLNY